MQAESQAAVGESAAPGVDGVDQVMDWRAAHEWVVGLAKTQAGLDYEQGVALLAAARAEVHLRLGFGSFHEYADRQLGYSPRHTYERLRVAKALEDLPRLTEALRSGSTSWSIIRELTRVATFETEQEWLIAATNKTVRTVEELVSGHRPGSRPNDLPSEGARRQVLRFDVSADVAATFREAVAQLGRQSGQRLDDEDVLLALARMVLVGPADTGRASYQIGLTVCERCGRGFQQAGGADTEVAPEVIEMARCDAQHVGAVGRPAASQCPSQPPSDGHVGTRIESEDRRSPPEGESLDTGARDEPFAHMGAHGAERDRTEGSRTRRATQSVPPATRRLVWRRDRGGCVVPGCRNHQFCDLHHLNPRAEGGGHDPEGLVILCGAHHRAAHDGRLIIEGRVTTGLRFLHADGTSYGLLVSPAASDTYTKVFRALRHLGYPETAAKRALGDVRAHAGVGKTVTDERVLREALSVLAA